MRNLAETASTERILSNESVSQRTFADWCKKLGVEKRDTIEGLSFTDKISMYDTVFKLGAENFLKEFLAQLEGIKFDIAVLKTELDTLRTEGNLVALGKREQEIAKLFQEAISSYDYEGTTNHPVDILARKEMNCVGASLIGGMLLEEVGIRCVLAGGGSHSFLIVVTSDDRILWQDMQDGKEKPELNNQELSTDKITKIESHSDIVSFVRNPMRRNMTFGVSIEHWNQENLITIEPFLPGIEIQELVNTGFQLTNSGRHKESLEILEVAMQKSPNVADVYLGLAKALRGLGRFSEAIVKCKKALELDPSYRYVQDEIDEIVKQMEGQKK